MIKKIYILLVLIFLLILLPFIFQHINNSAGEPEPLWSFMSIDTMKYSRDLARERLNDDSFDKVINQQVKEIASTGATHIGIDTPYDDEFYPMLQRWATAARKYNLKIWFRGNWSGWEGWFEYSKIDRSTHIKKTKEFILKHPTLFENGDVFTPCPECENGGPGDPRQTGDIGGFRKFMIDEYVVTKSAFGQIKKNVASNYNSMNGDVATAIMDRQTTKALDGIVTIDHYVATPEMLVEKVRQIESQSGGKVVLGEFGVPIPDINGEMTDKQQADWISSALTMLKTTPGVLGMSYWTNVGSTTALWDEDGSERNAVKAINNFYSVRLVQSASK